MDLSYDLLPRSLYWIAHLIYLAIMGYAAHTAPWPRLAQREQLHVFLGSSVMLLVVWSLKAGIEPGMDYHLLGATLFLLMFGWQFALMGMSLVLAGVTFNGSGDWFSFSLNALLMGVVPVFLSYVVLRLAVRFLPHHFFIYVLINGYFCAGFAMGVTLLAVTLLLGCCSSYTFSQLFSNYLPFAPMIIFAEGFFTGMLAASLAIMRPEWITTFDYRRYIAGK